MPQPQAPIAASSSSAVHAPVPPVPLNLPSSVKLAQPSSFTGNTTVNAETWLFEMEQYQNVAGLTTDTQRVAVATTYLRESAMTWWKMKCKTVPNLAVNDWNLFRTQFLERFQPIAATRAARFKLKELYQGNKSVTDYNNAFLSLVQQITDMSESDQVENYIHGLRNAVADRVEAKEPRTLQEAMLYAVRAEILLQNRQCRSNYSSSSSYRSNYYNSSDRSSAPHTATIQTSTTTTTPMELGNASLAAADAEAADDYESAEEDGIDWSSEYDRYCEEGDDYEPSSEVFSMMNEKSEAENQEQLQAMQQHRNNYSNRGRAPFMSREEFTRCMRLRLCLRCKKPGHVARLCPQRPNQPHQQQPGKKHFR